MNIASICQRDVVTIDEAATLRQAARLMRARHVGALVITAQRAGDSQLVGVVTDRDLALQVLTGDIDARAPVGALARTTLVTVRETASMADAVAAMRDGGVRRLLLVDQQRRLVGIVSLDDLIAAYAGELGDLAQALRRGIAHEAAQSAAAEAGSGATVIVPEAVASAWHRVVEP